MLSIFIAGNDDPIANEGATGNYNEGEDSIESDLLNSDHVMSEAALKENNNSNADVDSSSNNEEQEASDNQASNCSSKDDSDYVCSSQEDSDDNDNVASGSDDENDSSDMGDGDHDEYEWLYYKLMKTTTLAEIEEEIKKYNAAKGRRVRVHMKRSENVMAIPHFEEYLERKKQKVMSQWCCDCHFVHVCVPTMNVLTYK